MFQRFPIEIRFGSGGSQECGTGSGYREARLDESGPSRLFGFAPSPLSLSPSLSVCSLWSLFPCCGCVTMAPGQLQYELIVRQQPKQARMCGVGADRRPIDPPPIVQLRVIDPNGTPSRPGSPASSQSYLQNPYYFMFASLASVDTDDELHLLKDGKVGSVVSSLYHLKDTENGGQDAGFFVFPDLSVRTEGSYRLKLTLFEVHGCVLSCVLVCAYVC
ncbi:Velvet domain-containing protein [Rhizoctonia solani AG-1 IA]|uniref:Velvet domain-containing protein n=1 Tax=Thanatephorus cucumeris (strain AG1-IA) TaxID=983506 RepID=L8WKK3_THACA|nr:Velvet domain-containing protein [Rhizoctonia solani AG-1 IA]